MASFQKVWGETRDKEIRKPWRKEPARQCDAGKEKGQTANGDTDGAGAKATAKLGMPNLVFEDCFNQCVFPSPGFQSVGRSAALPHPWCALEASGPSEEALLHTGMARQRNSLGGRKLAPEGRGIGENEHCY